MKPLLILILSLLTTALAQGLLLTDSSHGPILSDEQGMTLYIFTSDTDGESSCYDACASAWPPLLVEVLPELPEGVSGELGLTTRKDGSLQLTLRGMPLYYFAGDSQAGDTNGQGLGNVWFVVQASED